MPICFGENLKWNGFKTFHGKPMKARTEVPLHIGPIVPDAKGQHRLHVRPGRQHTLCSFSALVPPVLLVWATLAGGTAGTQLSSRATLLAVAVGCCQGTP